MKRTMQNSWFIRLNIAVLVAVSLGFGSKAAKTWVDPSQILKLDDIKRTLTESFEKNEYPNEIAFPISGNDVLTQIEYHWDKELQQEITELFHSYNPNYASFVAIDPETGHVISLVNHVRNKKEPQNLALRASFPAASIFKVVTAAAVISSGQLKPESIVSVNGSYHTLYKRNVLNNRDNRWTKQLSLKEAFAHSVNSVFGRIGAFIVGPEHLKLFADRFFFNQKIQSDLPIQIGQAPIPSDTWGLIETASGFTRGNTLSPLHGALIAAGIANNGIVMQPMLIGSVRDQKGQLLYQSEPQVLGKILDGGVAREMRELMRETVTNGTSKKSFRGFFSGNLSQVDVGGKTGTLSGTDPKGKYDWFIGYGEHKGKKIAFASLAIHVNHWTVKSAYIARKALERYFTEIEKPVAILHRHRPSTRTVLAN